MEALERRSIIIVRKSILCGCHIIHLLSLVFAYTKFVYYVPSLSPLTQSQDIITREAPSKILHPTAGPCIGPPYPFRSAKRLPAIHHHEFFHIYFSHFLILPIWIISYQRHILLLGLVSHKYSIHIKRRRWGQK